MKTKNNIVYIYTIDYNGQVEADDKRATRKVLRNIKNDLKLEYGVCKADKRILMALNNVQ